MIITLFYSTGFTDSLGLALVHFPKAYDKWRCQMQRFCECLTPSLSAKRELRRVVATSMVLQ